MTSPALSVVVVVLSGRACLGRCLTALAPQVSELGAELIVPCDEGLGDVDGLRARFPVARFVATAGRRSYAELRALAFGEARGEVIALTEDHCTPDPDWCTNVLRAHEGPHAAVGGAVDKDPPDTALDWAVYLCDFSRYMSPLREGPARYLTDCNVSYKRAALELFPDLWHEEFHETTVHWALLERGESLWLSPRMVVRQQRSLGLGEALRERFAFGRLFASTRVAEAGRARRLLYAVSSPALPVLLLGRIASNVLRKRRRLGEFTRALPIALLLTTVWAAGECTGYLTGRA